tara:strand:- start:3262 stop:3672 length:411 start_codon:yes stop_codon:yes gene_type:complete
MTKLYEDLDGHDNEYSDRKGLRNFAWTFEALNDWEEIWHNLWALNYKWEWQNSDRYVRRYGDKYNFFSCHNDAVRLDMAIPLPGIVVLYEIRESLLVNPGDDQRLDHAVGAVDSWLKKHYTQREPLFTEDKLCMKE